MPSGSGCEPMANSDRPTIIEKYANRRLYNTCTFTFVTLDELAAMVKRGKNFLVYDAKTGADITQSVLAQIVFEQENFGMMRLSTRCGGRRPPVKHTAHGFPSPRGLIVKFLH
jgi:polyhydroxyalkanoate synthesis regulator protein